MQNLSQLHSYSEIVPKERTQWGSLVMLVSCTMIALAFIPLVPPVDVLEGGMTTRGVIEFALILGGLSLMAAYGKAQGVFSLDLNSPAFLLVSLFTFWALVSSAWSPNPILTIAKSAELGFIAVAAAMVVRLAAHHPREGRLEAILGLSLVAVTAGLILANLFIWGMPLPNTGDTSLPLDILDEEPSPERPRLMLGYAHPLLTGDLLALGVICLFASNLRTRWKVILIPALLGLLWITDARGPTGGLLVALIAMTILKLKRNDVRAIALTLVISSALAVALFFQSQLPAAFGSLFTDDVPTLNSRTDLWARTITHIVEQPVLGTGYYGSRYLLVKDFYWAGHAHNSFLEVMLTTGIFGLLILIFFVLYLFKEILTTRNAVLLGATLHCLIQGMLNPLLFYPGLAMFVVTVAALNARSLNGYAPDAKAGW